MAREVEVTELPDCDLCKAEGYQPVRKARYDASTRLGGWMNLCPTHFREFGYGLGTGVAQKLILKP
jgi:hypothetical protein